MARKQKHKGLFLRDSKWWVRYVDIDGKRKCRCIGSLEDATAAYRVEKARIKKHVPAPERAVGDIRYSELVDDALQYSKGFHKDVRMFRARLLKSRDQFGTRIASSIRPAEIKVWLSSHGWSAGTRNRFRAAMSKAFKLGIEAEKVSTNPARLVPQSKEPAGRIRFLHDDEETAIREALAKRPHCIRHLDVALNTGMRKGEQFTVCPHQVELSLGHIHLDATKNGSSRYVHLNSIALQAFTELLAEHKERGLSPDDPLFLSGRGIPIADPREWFKAACKEAKVKGVTWHTLRHTFASRLVMKGAGMKTLQDLMGHKTITMSARYSHLSPQHQRDALETLVRV